MEQQTQENMQGRRPRWTEEEDNFLAAKRRDGHAKKDIVRLYRESFPSTGRPDAGIMARIPTLTSARGDKRVAENDDGIAFTRPLKPEETLPSIGVATARVFEMLTPYAPEEKRRILMAVMTLSGMDKPSENLADREPTLTENLAAIAIGTSKRSPTS